ncbi:MAG: hypothetical protein JNG89_14170 [Planctomycetaceae bacterium]|nr:hypothetical protein [Planctomycetaceae bacterium]
MSEATTLVEQSADWRSEARVERSARLVRNVALAGPASRNGYRYAESALRDGAALYDRKPVFLDHAADSKRPQERSTRDLVGSVVHPRFEDGRIRGDIQVLDTEAGQTFLSLVESDAPGVGMSHVVLAERGGDGTVVERIHDVLSVDAVIGPATTTTFRESLDPATTDAAAANASEARLAAVLLERDELAARVAVLERRRDAETSRTAVQRMLAETGLPDYAATPLFVQQLSVADETQRRVLVAERRELIARASLLRPQSAERRDEGASAAATFVAAIRGRRR